MKLNVIHSEENSRPLSLKESGRVQMKAKYDRLWHMDPDSFNPENDARQKLQEKRVLASLQGFNGTRAADLGCGWGNGSIFLAEKGFLVDAVDISSKALKRVKPFSNINVIEGFIPFAPLDEGVYDVVLAANLLAEIPESLRRLAVSQIASLLKPEGKAVISTSLDIHAEDALPRFLVLLETEFDIEEVTFSYFYLNQKLSFFKKHKKVQLGLESLSNFLFPEEGISDVIVICKAKTIDLQY